MRTSERATARCASRCSARPPAPWKGADAVLAVMRATRDAAIDWHVFGDADAYGFPARAAEALGDAAGARLHLHGRYVRDEVVGLLARAAIDVTLILSPWPETFSYTLSESWAAGVPAIVLDTGAPAARVRASGAGLVVADAQQASAALERLARDPAQLDALAAAARAAARRGAVGGGQRRTPPRGVRRAAAAARAACRRSALGSGRP